MEFRGNTRNNGVSLPDENIEGLHIIKDGDDADPQRRYKMVYNTNDGTRWVFRTAKSADGIHWTAADHYATTKFIETASLYKFGGMWVVQGQGVGTSEGGHRSGRQGMAYISTDFDHWIEGHARLPEPEHPADRGHQKPDMQVHLGVGAASFGNVAVGLYGLWNNAAPWEERLETNGWFGHARTWCDLGLVLSNDGIHFRVPVKGRAFMSRFDAPATPYSRQKLSDDIAAIRERYPERGG